MSWPTDSELLHQELPEFRAPVIFPIKFRTSILGAMILDPEENAEFEIYQFITQFAAMMISIFNLHRKVDEQRATLEETTGILLKQND